MRAAAVARTRANRPPRAACASRPTPPTPGHPARLQKEGVRAAVAETAALGREVTEINK